MKIVLQTMQHSKLYKFFCQFHSVSPSFQHKCSFLLASFLFLSLSLQEDYLSDESISVTSSKSSSSSTKTPESQVNPDETSSSSSDSTAEDLSNVSVPISVCLMIMIR